MLRKTDNLNDTKWLEMQSHTELGFKMLKGIAFLKEALAIVPEVNKQKTQTIREDRLGFCSFAATGEPVTSK